MSENKLFPIVILAGGLATRLYPKTLHTPKSLIPINGKPFIYWQLGQLSKAGIKKVVICTGYLSDEIEEYVGNGSNFGLQVTYSKDGEKQLGTGGAIKKALNMLPEEFFITYGDSFLNIEYEKVQDTYTKSKKMGLLTVYHNNGQWDQSNADLEGAQVIYSKNKPNPNFQFIDYGLSILKKEAIQHMPSTFDLSSLLEELSEKNEIVGFEAANRFYEIGSLAGINDFEAFLTQQ